LRGWFSLGFGPIPLEDFEIVQGGFDFALWQLAHVMQQRDDALSFQPASQKLIP
jgi:hypothetical protein